MQQAVFLSHSGIRIHSNKIRSTARNRHCLPIGVDAYAYIHIFASANIGSQWSLFLWKRLIWNYFQSFCHHDAFSLLCYSCLWFFFVLLGQLFLVHVHVVWLPRILHTPSKSILYFDWPLLCGSLCVNSYPHFGKNSSIFGHRWRIKLTQWLIISITMRSHEFDIVYSLSRSLSLILETEMIFHFCFFLFVVCFICRCCCVLKKLTKKN